MFHKSCIQDWWKISRTCPLCRADCKFSFVQDQNQIHYLKLPFTFQHVHWQGNQLNAIHKNQMMKLEHQGGQWSPIWTFPPRTNTCQVQTYQNMCAVKVHLYGEDTIRLMRIDKYEFIDLNYVSDWQIYKHGFIWSDLKGTHGLGSDFIDIWHNFTFHEQCPTFQCLAYKNDHWAGQVGLLVEQSNQPLRTWKVLHQTGIDWYNQQEFWVGQEYQLQQGDVRMKHLNTFLSLPGFVFKKMQKIEEFKVMIYGEKYNQGEVWFLDIRNKNGSGLKTPHLSQVQVVDQTLRFVTIDNEVGFKKI